MESSPASNPVLETWSESSDLLTDVETAKECASPEWAAISPGRHLLLAGLFCQILSVDGAPIVCLC